MVTSQPTHGTVNFNTTTGTFTYTPTDTGYVGTDTFTYTVSDGQQGAEPAVGTVTLTLTNALPFANNGSVSGSVNITIDGSVLFGDKPDNFANGEIDPLTVLITQPTLHGIVTFDTQTGKFIYVPNAGYIGEDSLTYSVSDGQQGANPANGIVTIQVTGNPVPMIPAAPLPVIQAPEISGCPLLLQVAAAELGTTKENIQVSIQKALATASYTQPCDGCSRLVKYAQILNDADGSNMAAAVQVFNEIAPADTPFTPELSARIADAMRSHINDPLNPQYAKAMEFVDAFANYISVVKTDLGSPIDNPVEYVMQKHGGAVLESNNAALKAFIAARLEAIGG